MDINGALMRYWELRSNKILLLLFVVASLVFMFNLKKKISSPFCAVSEPQCLFINKEFTNHDCDADDNFDKKKRNSYFTYESRDTLVIYFDYHCQNYL